LIQQKKVIRISELWVRWNYVSW